MRVTVQFWSLKLKCNLPVLFGIVNFQCINVLRALADEFLYIVHVFTTKMQEVHTKRVLHACK